MLSTCYSLNRITPGLLASRPFCASHRTVAGQAGRLHFETMKTHGLSHVPEYIVWESMRARCNNPKHPHYENYGGRGITICARWNDFKLFLTDMGRRPTNKHTLERVLNNEGYGPENCIWATRDEQANNKRNNRILSAFGQKHNLTEWSRIIGITPAAILWRLDAGWNLERALTP